MGTPQVNLKNHIAINSSWLTLVRPGRVLTLHLKGKKVFSVENIHRLLLGLLLVSRLIYYDILINIFRDCLFSRFASPESTGPASWTRTKAARTEFEQVWTWWGGWSYIFPCPQILAFERSFQKRSEVYASGGNLSLCCIIALLFIENPNMNKINIAIWLKVNVYWYIHNF